MDFNLKHATRGRSATSRQRRSKCKQQLDKPKNRILSEDPRITLSSPLPDGAMTLWFEPDKCYLELPDLYRRKVRTKSGGRIALGVTHIDSGFITLYQNRAIKRCDDYTVEVVVQKLVEMLLENARRGRQASRRQGHSDA